MILEHVIIRYHISNLASYHQKPLPRKRIPQIRTQIIPSLQSHQYRPPHIATPSPPPQHPWRPPSKNGVSSLQQSSRVWFSFPPSSEARLYISSYWESCWARGFGTFGPLHVPFCSWHLRFLWMAFPVCAWREVVRLLQASNERRRVWGV